VILLSAEDDPADTIRPRLDALGADVRRISILTAIRDRSGERSFNLVNDIPQLAAAIAKNPGIAMIVIDPISAYLGGTDSHKNTDVRAILAPLAALAARTGIAIVCVTHLSKGAADPLNRLSGSIAFGAAARAVWLVTRDPDQSDRRLFLSLKNNLAREAGGLAFAIQPDSFGAPIVAWEADPITETAGEILQALRDLSAEGSQRGSLEAAAKMLRELLETGSKSSEAVKSAAEERGISWRTITTARKLLGVETSKKGFSGGWMMSLPEGRNPPSIPVSSEVCALRPTPSLPTASPKDANPDGDGEDRAGALRDREDF
jgi:hypothetical protein